MTGAKKFEKGPCSTKKSKNDSVPPKFEKRPCSTKIWEATMLHRKIWKATMLHQKMNMTVFHQNLRSDHAPSKNKNDRAPPKCDKWPQILVEHLIFGPACPQLRVFSKNDHVPPKFEKRPCSTEKIEMTRNDHAPLEKWPCSIEKFEKRPCSIEKFEKRPCSIKKFEKRPCSIKKLIWPCSTKFEKRPCYIKKLIQPCSTKMWQMASNSGGTWSFLKLAWSLLKFFDGVWSLLKFLWSMVVSQILVEPGHINFPPEFEKWQCSTRIWEMTMFHQILKPFWWNIFRWSMVAFQLFGTYVFWWTQKPHVFWWTQKIMKGPLKDMRFWVHQKTWGFRRGKKRWDMSFLGPSKNIRFQEGKGPSKDMRFLGPSKDMRFR